MTDSPSVPSPTPPGASPAGFSFVPIGRVRSPFEQPFGIPRQASLAQVRARVELDPARLTPEALRGLEGVTHVWLLWVFDRSDPAHTHATVRPPRLGGNTRLGVLATRAPQRPNPIGMSAVRLVGVEGLVLHIEGCDLADGTPVLDVKPYVASCDRLDGTDVAWLHATDERKLEVRWSEPARAQLEARPDAEEFAAELEPLLALDPRPGYRGEGDDRDYAMAFAGLDVRFRVDGETLTITALVPHAS